MKGEKYACNNEYQGGVVGTLREIQEHMDDHGWSVGDCEFYELGDKVQVGLKVI